MDSVILNMEKLLLNQKVENNGFVDNCSELAILEKNKQIFLSKNQVNFNVLVVGESGAGKTTFIKNFLKKVEKLTTKGKNNQNDISMENNSFNVYCEQNFPINEDDIKSGIYTSKFDSYKVNHLSNSHNYNFRIIDSPGYPSHGKQNDWLNQILEYIHRRVTLTLYRTLNIITTSRKMSVVIRIWIIVFI
jgi:septin family protein